MSPNVDFDVIVVGASLAGASLAARLKGLRVLVIDKAAFPRRKACGEGLCDAGVALAEEVISLPSGVGLSGYRIVSGKRATLIPGSILGIEREVLDAEMIRRAGGRAELLLGCQVREIRRDGNYFSVRAGGRWISGKKLVLADGVNSFLAPRIGIACGGDAARYGLSFMYEGRHSSARREVTIVRKTWGELFCTPVSENRVNVSLLGGRSLFDEHKRMNLGGEVEAHTGFSGAPADDPKACGRLETACRAAVMNGIIFAGDACESLDPVGGMGMTHALGSAKLAAEAIEAMLVRGEPEAKALRKYAETRERFARPLRRVTALSGFFVQQLSGTPFAPVATKLEPILFGRMLRSSLEATAD